MSETLLTLASASPRRREILDALRVRYDVRPAGIDETRADGESPADMVLRVSLDKARTVAGQVDGVVLGADTAVVLDHRIFGKPVDEADALAMLAALSGATHTVMTGVAVIDRERVEHLAMSATEVSFCEISPDEARRYWQSGEPGDKAGAYAIQGLGGMFVTGIVGSFSGVVGLPVFETMRLLRTAGIAPWQDNP